jgi:hypothetical protein
MICLLLIPVIIYLVVAYVRKSIAWDDEVRAHRKFGGTYPRK